MIGGAPRPKLPRGTGVPPIASNWAALSLTRADEDEPGEVERKPEAGVESGGVDCEGGVDWAVVRSWRPSAAILSLRETVVMGTRCDLLKVSAHRVESARKVFLHYVVWSPDDWHCRVCSLLQTNNFVDFGGSGEGSRLEPLVEQQARVAQYKHGYLIRPTETA